MGEDLLDLIKSRRNIKRFLPKFVSWDKISLILEAGSYAPSCGNIQNWKFIVVYESDIKEIVAEACYDQLEIIQAGVLIIVCAEPEKASRYYGLRGERLFSIQNCAAAIQNMLLEAKSLGLGARWVGGFDEDKIKSLMNIPEEVRPQAVIAIGYPQEIPNKPSKYSLESLVYFGKWKNTMRDPAKYMNSIATIMARKGQVTKDVLKKAGEFILNKTKETSQKIINKNK